MNELYIFSFVNLVLCLAVIFIAVCRLNAMQDDVLLRVRVEYAGYVAGAFLAAFQPWWGEWPKWGSLAVIGSIFCGLLCSSGAWKGDTPPEVATDHGELQ